MNFQQVSETQFVIPVPDIDHVNHLVVFMTGQIPFPENFGGGGKYHVISREYQIFLFNFSSLISVYFSWPSTTGPSWIYLGKIMNTKPSAIFKINKTKGSNNLFERKSSIRNLLIR